jgi:acyl-CoA thioesterase-2
MTELEGADREDLLTLLDVQSAGQGAFTGPAAKSRAFATRVFGGQLIGQALAAASFTVPDDVLAHSLHAYFARPGIPNRPIDYEVTAVRDGQSYAIRSVAAVQRDEMVFQLTASFAPDHGGPEFQPAMPETPAPESFGAFEEFRAKYLARVNAVQRAMILNSPCDGIPVDLAELDDSGPKPTRTRIWLRPHQKLPNDPILHRCVLAYCSDMGLLRPSVFAIGADFMDPELQIASLDHSVWFHRPFVWDDWMLFVAESLTVSAGRGLNRGAVYSRDGRLVASLAQEGIIRKRNILPDV